jgi:hypothetical protein
MTEIAFNVVQQPEFVLDFWNCQNSNDQHFVISLFVSAFISWTTNWWDWLFDVAEKYWFRVSLLIIGHFRNHQFCRIWS